LFSRQQAKAFYDHFGRKQDEQSFYEDPALQDLIDHAAFAQARTVFELGCGTGRFAERLLEHHLPPSAVYRGTDLSDTMVALARKRLCRFGNRVEVLLTDGSLTSAADSVSVDAFVSTYVLDLLPDEDIRAVLAEARRVLRPGGCVCMVSLTHGRTGLSRFVSWLWKRVHALRPGLVGGCRPLNLLDFMDDRDWHLDHANVVVAYGIPSEIIVASPR
jgi:ubiquinone/menaquinone biosynthesis C-methylase UbiE